MKTITINNQQYPVFDELPKGWVIIKGATTAPKGYKWIRSTKSIFDKNKKLAFLEDKI